MLEPVMRLGLDVPSECLQDLLKDLAARRGRIRLHDSRGETHHISAIAPLAQLFGVESSVRELTRGRGSCDVQFAGYVPLQAADGDSGGDRDSLVGAPRKPSPTLRQSRIELPEPEENDPEP